ncbi:BLUF domain-containing protein [Nocardioides sp. J2M5]|uniref:BLUF domain-containing protein n=1 Tax=Nocardioides palaemonis TaxID=2829810 RepID=UPI001BA6795C|nr:BLUF domain-containing protein [Nocardioides palaemonis]MBS2938369.1 BLUF domain-containing protein [Nocardioides palaemonis]
MLSLTYLSSAVDLLSRDDLARLLTHARANNERLGITGMMLYSDGSFIQTLEGPADHVDALFTLIDADPRHHQVFIVRREQIDERHFPAWRMDYREISEEEASGLPGFTDYLHTGVIEGEERRRHAAWTFHRAFRDTLT